MNGMLTRELLSARGEQTTVDDDTGFIAETLIHCLIFCEEANTLSHLEPSLPNTHIQSNLYLHFTLSLFHHPSHLLPLRERIFIDAALTGKIL